MGGAENKDEFEEMWDENAEEAENEVGGLSLSFITVQAIRFWLTISDTYPIGVLPNIEGQEINATSSSNEESVAVTGDHPGCWYRLMAIGFLCVPLTIFLNSIKEKLFLWLLIFDLIRETIAAIGEEGSVHSSLR